MLSTTLLSTVTTADVPACEIMSVTEDSRRAALGSLFICIRGARFDGHTLAPQAYENGCRFFVAEEPLTLPADATVITVPNTRSALARIACTFYENPSHSLHVIGITGTKGKTTTASLICDVLNASKVPCGYIGTNGILYGDVRKATVNTTPDAITLQRTLSEMKAAGMRAVAMEVSSQAILQDRVCGMRFATTVFTNFSKDHIGPGEHPTLQNYKDCKHRLFTDFGATTALWNSDDPTTSAMRVGASAARHLFYSAQGTRSDVYATDVHAEKKADRLGVSFTLHAKDLAIPCHLPLIGTCNVANALCAAAIAADTFGISLDRVATALSSAVVAGRSECYALPSGAVAVIDYAHNRESLYQVLSSLREYRPHRLYCLFGSVGERTKLRRRDLAEVAAALADECIITSDNPGNESPEEIIDEIASYLPIGFPHANIPDRAEAIRYAIARATVGDVILLAGKGHENYQLIGNEKIPFDERKIIEELISAPSFT